MINADNTQSWLDQHTANKLVGHDLPWLSTQRAQGLEHFERIGLPGVRDEEWRYTNLRALKSNLFALPTEAPNSLENITLPASNNHRLVFINGDYCAALSTVSELGDEIVFASLSEILTKQPELIESRFGSTLPKLDQQHGFTHLNTAFCKDGYVLHLPKNAICADVLEVVFVNHNTHTKDEAHLVTHSRNLIIASANSQCTVIERHVGDAGQVYLNNSVTEIIANDNAHIDHYKLQQESDDAFHIGGVFIQQHNNAQVSNHNVCLNGLVTRNDIHCDLLGEGGHIEMNGLVLGVGRQHIDNNTQVNHVVPNCSSDEYYKTILDDHSRSVFRGRIVVAQDAQQTNADQQNNNLLLSKHAEADAKPQLEIYADDVKCSHGATVGQLEDKSLFYLRSRGIDQQSAYGLLTFAFANEVIERIKVDSVRQQLTEIIAGQLLSGLEELL